MRATCVLVCAAALGVVARADVTVNYILDAGGENTEPLNGLSARATFTLSGSGTELTILLENTSTGVPASFDASDQLLSSLGMNLPVNILAGDWAVIGPGSVGLGVWSTRGPGDSVAEEWLWTNEFGGDLMEAWQHVISTNEGQGGGTTTRFDGGTGTVAGPFGGIAADPPHRKIPDKQMAISDSAVFHLRLTAAMTEAQLLEAANGSIVEFGSDQRYLLVPEASSLLLLGLGALPLLRRVGRRSA